MSKQYWVNEWASHPDLDNDDCMTGQDFETKEEALHYLATNTFSCYIQFLELDGPDINQVTKNPSYSKKQQKLDGGDWHREMAHEAGMLHGVEGWNDFYS